mmetsp:Transcript_17101/g.64767  ORF Transcript_17101/g.64767 Transcript_17101/m.64767 type:complete len:204 (+) Transcript_17101:499-1110(+)
MGLAVAAIGEAASVWPGGGGAALPAAETRLCLEAPLAASGPAMDLRMLRRELAAQQGAVAAAAKRATGPKRSSTKASKPKAQMICSTTTTSPTARRVATLVDEYGGTKASMSARTSTRHAVMTAVTSCAAGLAPGRSESTAARRSTCLASMAPVWAPGRDERSTSRSALAMRSATITMTSHQSAPALAWSKRRVPSTRRAPLP